jgi:3-oxoacyl-[acyl-carrier-protein] synthase II
MGCVCPLGHELGTLTLRLKEGASGIVSVSDRLHPEIPSRVAGVIPELPLDAYIPPKEQRRMDRFIQIGLIAGVKAWEDSGLTSETMGDPGRIGVIAGVGMGGIPFLVEQQKILESSGPRRVSPFLIPAIIPNLVSGFISMRLGLKGVNYALVSACASSAHALGEGLNKIRWGEADVILAGGAESLIMDLTMAGFCSMKALSTKFNDQPPRASRPFDQLRDGFVMAEGGSFVVLESERSARKRGAKIYAEVLGYGATADAYHISLPAPEGEGGERSMRLAIEDAGIPIGSIGYVNAHGTSTPAGDELEVSAISRVMGSHVSEVFVSSTKSMTGHMLGAAGSSEIIFSILAIRDGFYPPTLNLEDPVSSYGLNWVGPKPVPAQSTCFLKNSFGFGGTNASLVLKVFQTSRDVGL